MCDWSCWIGAAMPKRGASYDSVRNTYFLAHLPLVMGHFDQYISCLAVGLDGLPCNMQELSRSIGGSGQGKQPD